MPPTSLDLKCHEEAGGWELDQRVMASWMGVLRMDGCTNEYTSAGASFWAYADHRNYTKNDTAATAGKAWEHVAML